MRRFSFHNIWFWAANVPLVILWYLFARESLTNGGGVLYIILVSIYANEMTAIGSWIAARVADDALTVDELVEQTEINRAG